MCLLSFGHSERNIWHQCILLFVLLLFLFIVLWVKRIWNGIGVSYSFLRLVLEYSSKTFLTLVRNLYSLTSLYGYLELFTIFAEIDTGGYERAYFLILPYLCTFFLMHPLLPYLTIFALFRAPLLHIYYVHITLHKRNVIAQWLLFEKVINTMLMIRIVIRNDVIKHFCKNPHCRPRILKLTQQRWRSQCSFSQKALVSSHNRLNKAESFKKARHSVGITLALLSNKASLSF